MQKQIFKIFFLLVVFLILPNFTQAAPIPALNFSDIDSGPKTGNTDGVGSGAIVTIWGNYLGSTQGTSKVFVGDQEATAIYYWKNADGQLPGGPAELYSYHKMQEIAFAIPATAPDGLTTIKVVVNGIETNTLPFTVRSGNIYFIKSGGNDTTGNGSWNNAWGTLQNVFNGGNGKLAAGDIVYSVGVGSDAGMSVGINGAIKGTQNAPVSLLTYPNTSVVVTGKGYVGTVIYNYWSTNVALSSDYINFSKLSVIAGQNATDLFVNGFTAFLGNRIIGVEITGPTVYQGYGGAITGGGFSGSGGKYYGIYMHDYGWKSTEVGVGNYGWIYNHASTYWTSPSDCATHMYYARPSCTGEPGGCTYENLNCRFSVDRFQHLYYISNRTVDSVPGYEIAWNHLSDNPILHGIHIYDMGTVGGWSSSIIIHDNVVKNQRGDSIDVSYPTPTVGANSVSGYLPTIYIYNNIIVNDVDNKDNGSAFNISGPGLAKVYNNTIYGYRYTNYIRPGNSDFRNNIMIESITPDASDYKYYSYDTPTTKSNNLFYGTHSSPMPSWFSAGAGDLNANPLFTDASNYNFSLQATSPAKTAGSDATLTTAPTDFYGQPRVAGSVSVGAIQYVSPEIDILAPAPPTGLGVM